jgi:hypothetical protein
LRRVYAIYPHPTSISYARAAIFQFSREWSVAMLAGTDTSRTLAGKSGSNELLRTRRRGEPYPTPSEMFRSLGLALCVIVYMVLTILLFARLLVH